MRKWGWSEGSCVTGTDYLQAQLSASLLFSVWVSFSSAARHHEGSKFGGSVLFSCIIAYKTPKTTLTWASKTTCQLRLCCNQRIMTDLITVVANDPVLMDAAPERTGLAFRRLMPPAAPSSETELRWGFHSFKLIFCLSAILAFIACLEIF